MAWKSIEEQMLPTTVEKEMVLNETLMSLKKGSLSLDDYIKRFKSLCDNLAAIKKPVDETRKVFQLARGLGPKYQDFRTAMLTKPPYPSFQQFVTALQAHEQMNQEYSDSSLRHDQAFVSQQGRGCGRNGGRFSSRGRGFNPAAKHNSQPRQNYQNNNGNKSQSSNSFNHNQQGKASINCQICGKANHSAIECWNRFDHSFQPEDQLHKAFSAMNLKQSDDPNLYADSAAIAHMVNDPVNSPILNGIKAIIVFLLEMVKALIYLILEKEKLIQIMVL